MTLSKVAQAIKDAAKAEKAAALKKPVGRPKKAIEGVEDKLILALDPSLKSSGWALVKVSGGVIKLLDCGEIKTNVKQSHGERLRVIRDSIQKVIKYQRITDVVKEKGFSRFPRETQALFKVHGVAEELFADFTVDEYAVTTIKKEVGGSGKSTKEEVALGVKQFLKLPDEYKFTSDDASDAVGVALTHIIKMKYIRIGG